MRRTPPRTAIENGPAVHVWGLSLSSISAGEFGLLSSLCTRAELDRAARFVFARDRRAYLAAHALLRFALSEHEPERPPRAWSFQTGEHGRPEIAESFRSQLRFNLSHCLTRVVCVVCRTSDCGIDVEPLARGVGRELLCGRVLSTAELDWVHSVAPGLRTQRFLRLWTLKEAISKALGLGLALPFEQLELDLSGTPTLVSAPPTAPPPWWLVQRRPTAAHVEALAVRVSAQNPPLLFWHEWNGDLSYSTIIERRELTCCR